MHGRVLGTDSFSERRYESGDLVNEIGLAQPTISQHLKELKHLGLIKGNVEGTSVCYCIHKENWMALKLVMNEFLNQDVTDNDNCC